jgi:hypothetical protein
MRFSTLSSKFESGCKLHFHEICLVIFSPQETLTYNLELERHFDSTSSNIFLRISISVDLYHTSLLAQKTHGALKCRAGGKPSTRFPSENIVESGLAPSQAKLDLCKTFMFDFSIFPTSSSKFGLGQIPRSHFQFLIIFSLGEAFMCSLEMKQNVENFPHICIQIFIFENLYPR